MGRFQREYLLNSLESFDHFIFFDLSALGLFFDIHRLHDDDGHLRTRVVSLRLVPLLVDTVARRERDILRISYLSVWRLKEPHRVLQQVRSEWKCNRRQIVVH